jgi:hypothetical protein
MHDKNSNTASQNDLVAQVVVTFAVTKTGTIRLTSNPVFYSPETVKPEHEIKDEELKALLARGTCCALFHVYQRQVIDIILLFLFLQD